MVPDGTPYVVRLNVPTEGECIFHDELRDEIRIAWSQVDHQVLRKVGWIPYLSSRQCGR